MYCPNCGNKNNESQRFCRICGLGLEKVAETLGEQLPTKADVSLLQRKEKLERLGVAALSVFGLSVLSFLLYSVFYKLMLTQGKFLAGLAVLGLAIVVGCGLLSVILFAKANELKEAAGKRSIGEPEKLSSSQTTGRLLEEPREPAFRVTDRTTELLPINTRGKVSGD